jgi:hypothetical protein
VSAAEDAHEAFAAQAGLKRVAGFKLGAVTPLLARGGSFGLACAGSLAPELEGTIARLRLAGDDSPAFDVVFARIPESQGHVPRLACQDRARTAAVPREGFAMRSSRLWTESEVLNERYRVTVSPFQDDNWLRQLFIPTFIDYLAHTPPRDFSFELAYGSLLCSMEEDEPTVDGLGALWASAATVARRIREESLE